MSPFFRLSALLFVVACGAPGKPEAPPSTASDAAAAEVMTSNATTPNTDAGAGATSEPASAPKTNPTVTGETDPQAALASAKKEGKATLLVFCAKWVAACGELSNTLADGDVQKTLTERFIVARVDATSEDDPTTKERMKRFNVKGLPSVIVFDRKGKEVGRESGYVDTNKLTRLLEKAK